MPEARINDKKEGAVSDRHRDSTFGLQCTVAAKVTPEKNIKSDLKKKSLLSKFFLSWWQKYTQHHRLKIIIRRERFCGRGARQSCVSPWWLWDTVSLIQQRLPTINSAWSRLLRSGTVPRNPMAAAQRYFSGIFFHGVQKFLNDLQGVDVGKAYWNVFSAYPFKLFPSWFWCQK